MGPNLEKVDEVYEIVSTRIVCIASRAFRMEVRKCLKGNLAEKYDYTCQEEEELYQKGDKADTSKSCWCRISMPYSVQTDAESAMQDGLNNLAAMVGSGR